MTAKDLYISFVDWNFKETTLVLGHQQKGKTTYTLSTIAEKEGPGWRSKLFQSPQGLTVLYSLNLRKQLLIATQGQGPTWESKILMRNTGNFTAAQHKDKTLYVAYEDVETPTMDGGHLKLLERRQGVWSTHTIDADNPNASYLDMAVNSKGKIAILYYTKRTRSLKVYDETL